MANHGARTHIKCARTIMQEFGFGDESPRYVVALRNRYKLRYPSEAIIQRMFGQRLELAKRDISLGIISIFNQEKRARGQTEIPENYIVHFNSVVNRLGHIVNEHQRQNGTASNTRAEIAAGANLEEEVIDAAMHKRLLPRQVCLDIENALIAMGVRTYGVDSFPDAVTDVEIPARDVRMSVLNHISQIC